MFPCSKGHSTRVYLNDLSHSNLKLMSFLCTPYFLSKELTCPTLPACHVSGLTVLDKASLTAVDCCCKKCALTYIPTHYTNNVLQKI